MVIINVFLYELNDLAEKNEKLNATYMNIHNLQSFSYGKTEQKYWLKKKSSVLIPTQASCFKRKYINTSTQNCARWAI